MIRSFKHKELKKFFETGQIAKINQAHAKRLRLILAKLQTAHEIKDMNFPGSNLHPLTGDKKGFWSAKVNWRIIFRLEEGDVYEADFIDYH